MRYQVKILGETIWVNNKVAAALAEQYAERFPDDRDYVLGKVAGLERQAMSDSLMEWFNLDSAGRQMLARNLRMSVELLDSTCEGIKWIYNH